MAKFSTIGALGALIGALLAALIVSSSVASAAPTNPSSGSADIGVAVVIDFGPSSHAPGIKHCAKVPPGSTDADVLAQVAQDLRENPPTYAPSGMPCSIDGYPGSGCGGPQPANTVAYWSYWRSTANAWSYSTVAPASYHVQAAGDVEGWRFQDSGSGTSSDPAPGVDPDYAAICPPDTTPTTPFSSTTTVLSGIVGSLGGAGTGGRSTSGTTTPARSTGGSADASSGATATPTPSGARGQAAGRTASAPSGATPWLVIGPALVVVLGAVGLLWWRSRRPSAPADSL